MNEATLRMIERLIAVLIGGGAIYLGFQLFKIVPYVKTGEGKFIFPGGSVHLLRTGPGVFFALFGCAIVYWSFSHPIYVGKPRPEPKKIGVAQADTVQPLVFFHGLSSRNKAEMKIWIQNLNRIEEAIDATKLPMKREEATITIGKVKLNIVRQMMNDPFDPDFPEFSIRIRINSSQQFEGKWKEWADVYNQP